MGRERQHSHTTHEDARVVREGLWIGPFLEIVSGIVTGLISITKGDW